MTWDALRKSINGLVNKVNITNIKQILPEFFGEVGVVRCPPLLLSSMRMRSCRHSRAIRTPLHARSASSPSHKRPIPQTTNDFDRRTWCGGEACCAGRS